MSTLVICNEMDKSLQSDLKLGFTWYLVNITFQPPSNVHNFSTMHKIKLKPASMTCILQALQQKLYIHRHT